MGKCFYVFLTVAYETCSLLIRKIFQIQGLSVFNRSISIIRVCSYFKAYWVILKIQEATLACFQLSAS